LLQCNIKLGLALYLVVIAWLYVALMMAVAEANHPLGTLLGAVVTFVLYGAGPVALLIYLMGRSGRRAKREAREAAALAAQPDRGGEASADAVAPVREEP
jgi:Kef-type K+ transport system membrane component KefB